MNPEEPTHTTPRGNVFEPRMSSTPRKRPKPGTRTPEPKPSSSSSSSPPSFCSSLIEPPSSLFPSKAEFFRLITMLAIASFVAFTCNFIVTYLNQTDKPFCDSNIESPDSLSSFCEPCPRNGVCNEGKLECARGYKKHGSICVEDGDVNERAKKLSKVIQNHLCEAYAQFLCEGTGKVWVQEYDLRNVLDGHELMEKFGSDDLNSMNMKKRTMEIIGRSLEMRTDSHGKKEFKCPDLLVDHYKPFTCCVRQWISKHAIVIFPVFAMVVISSFLLWKIRRRWSLSTRSEELYDQVCDILEETALTSKTAKGEQEPWVVASRLRDHLLLPKERKDPVLWKKVEELVQEDSRIDRYPRLVKGDTKVVWEWQVDGSLSSTRMRKREGRKLISAEVITTDQQNHVLKTEPMTPMF